MKRKYPVDAPASWVAMCKVIARRNGYFRRSKVKRYPLQPLLDALAMSSAQLNTQVRMNRDSYRVVRDRGLTESMADRLCIRFGLHPLLVWPDWLDAASVLCADEECSERFVASRRGQRFCWTPDCKRRRQARMERERRRLRYATDPEYAEKRRAERRAYYAANRRAEKVKRRRRWVTGDERLRVRDPEKRRAESRRYREANRERLAQYQRDRRAKKAAA